MGKHFPRRLHARPHRLGGVVRRPHSPGPAGCPGAGSAGAGRWSPWCGRRGWTAARLPSRIFGRRLPRPRHATRYSASSRPCVRPWLSREASDRLPPRDLAARPRDSHSWGANLVWAQRPGRRGRAVPSAPLPAPSSRRPLAGPLGQPRRREGAGKVGTRSPAPSAAWPAQPSPDPGGQAWKSDASGRAGGARPKGLVLAVPSPHQMTRPPPGSPSRGGGRSFCPTLFTHSPPLLPVPAPANIPCAFLWSFLPRSPYCNGLICQWQEPR